LYTDNPVVVATSVASTDLSDIAIDDDRSLLDEFLASQTLTSGKYDQRVFVFILTETSLNIGLFEFKELLSS